MEPKFIDLYKEDFESEKKWEQVMEQVNAPKDKDFDHLELKVVQIQIEER